VYVPHHTPMLRRCIITGTKERFEGYTPPQLGAAMIKKYSSYRTYPKKVPRVFFPKLVHRDLKSPPEGWQMLIQLLPSSDDFVHLLLIQHCPISPPLGIECVTLVPHAHDSGSTVAGGQHFPMPLWSQNHDSFFPAVKIRPHCLKYKLLHHTMVQFPS